IGLARWVLRRIASRLSASGAALPASLRSALSALTTSLASSAASSSAALVLPSLTAVFVPTGRSPFPVGRDEQGGLRAEFRLQFIVERDQRTLIELDARRAVGPPVRLAA